MCREFGLNQRSPSVNTSFLDFVSPPEQSGRLATCPSLPSASVRDTEPAGEILNSCIPEVHVPANVPKHSIFPASMPRRPGLELHRVLRGLNYVRLLGSGGIDSSSFSIVILHVMNNIILWFSEGKKSQAITVSVNAVGKLKQHGYLEEGRYVKLLRAPISRTVGTRCQCHWQARCCWHLSLLYVAAIPSPLCTWAEANPLLAHRFSHGIDIVLPGCLFVLRTDRVAVALSRCSRIRSWGWSSSSSIKAESGTGRVHRWSA